MWVESERSSRSTDKVVTCQRVEEEGEDEKHDRNNKSKSEKERDRSRASSAAIVAGKLGKTRRRCTGCTQLTTKRKDTMKKDRMLQAWLLQIVVEGKRTRSAVAGSL